MAELQPAVDAAQQTSTFGGFEVGDGAAQRPRSGEHDRPVTGVGGGRYQQQDLGSTGQRRDPTEKRLPKLQVGR
jgi:hypothetical protein